MAVAGRGHKVTLFFVGAPRSGSTFLYDVFRQHPSVFVPEVKEPHFFCTDMYEEIGLQRGGRRDRSIGGTVHGNLIRNLNEYEQLFQNAGGFSQIAEFTPVYLASTAAAQNIFDYNPDASVVAVLRDPVKRAQSHYRMDIGNGDLTCSFEEAIQADRSRYVKPGLYYEQVMRFLQTFPSERITLLRFEELTEEPATTLAMLCHSLDVAPPTATDIERARTNRADRQPRNPALTNWLRNRTRLLQAANAISPALVSRLSAGLHKTITASSDDRRILAQLHEIYSSDIEALEGLIGWNLDSWKK